MRPKTKTILFILLSFALGIFCGWFLKDQIAQVDSLLEIRRDVYRKQMFAMRDTTQMEIRKFLSANQNKLFDGVIQEMNEREAKKRNQEATKK